MYWPARSCRSASSRHTTHHSDSRADRGGNGCSLILLTARYIQHTKVQLAFGTRARSVMSSLFARKSGRFPAVSRARCGLVVAAMLTFGALTPSPALAAWTSPGKLARSHKHLKNACAKCHEPGEGVTNKKCLDCHKSVTKSRFHRKQVARSGKACATCHRDHHGSDFRMIRWRPPTSFPHGETGWALQGQHAKVACATCHKRPQRWMGLRSRCTSCHSDPHKPTLGTTCTNCHTQRAFSPAPMFRHTATRFSLQGAHRRVTCASCHTKNAAKDHTKNAAKKPQFRGISFAKCSSCHGEPTPKHSRGLGCDSCHSQRSWQPAAKGSGLKIHAKIAFKLRGKHRRVACEGCHSERSAKGALADAGERLRLFSNIANRPRTGPKTATGTQAWGCVDCHSDPHAGQQGTRCQDCHSETGWRTRTTKGQFDHDRTAFPLTGAHRAVDCSSCHKTKGSFKQRFQKRAHDACTDCHKDPHDQQFARPSVTSKTETAAACQSCHSTEQFAPTVGFDHVNTAFPLTGPHAKATCASCHVRPRKGAAVEFRSTPHACASCHADVHAGQFKVDGPVKTCGDCHSVTGGFARADFDHANTRFIRRGEHAKATCEKCHTKVRAPDGREVVHYRLGALQCRQCHSDPHAFAGSKP